MDVGKIFPGFRYWARLPGFTAFCGISTGICAAKICLAACHEYVPNTLIYILLLLITSIVFMVCGCLSKRAWARFALLAAGGAALFLWSEFDIRNFYGRMESASENRRLLTLTLRISGPVAQTPAGGKFRAKVVGADDEEIARALKGRTLQCLSKQPAPPLGVITAQGRYAAPHSAAGPFGFDMREHFAVNNIGGSFFIDVSTDNTLTDNTSTGYMSTGNISYAIRTRVRDVINMAETQEARGIFLAAFLGEREQLPKSLKTVFRKAGIIHLLAISGFHAALLFSAVFALLSLPRIPSRAKTLIALAVLWGYLFLIGFIPSLFRATAMATLLCASILLQRKNHIVHTLGLAGFFWLCISPHSLFAPGFQLSFAATAGIAMLRPALDGITGAVNSKISGNPVKFLVEKALSPLWVSVAAFAATAPTLLYHFGTLSLYGILFNLIAIPLMSGAMWLFFAAAALSPVAAAAKALIFCSEKILSLMIFMAGFCERIPASEIAVPYVHPALLAAMAAFMAGLCAVRVKLRGVYALRAGTATVTAIAVAALYATVTAKTEVFAPRGNGATAQVVIYKDNAAWVVLQGRRKEARNLRIRDIEPLLVRKTVRSLPLVVVDETLEDEAHELAFNTGFEPQITVLRDRGADFASGGDRRYGYTNIDGTGLAAADGSCRLTIGADGQVALTAK